MLGPEEQAALEVGRRGATIGQSASLIGGRSDIVLNSTVHEDVRFGTLVGDRTDVGGSVTVLVGTLIRNNVTIQAGATVRENIPDDADVIG